MSWWSIDGPLTAVVVAAVMSVPPQTPTIDPALKATLKTAIDEGLRGLRWRVESTGTWDNDPVTTALVVRAFVESHRQYVEEDGPFIRNAIAFLKARAPWASGAEPDSSRVGQGALTVLVLQRLKHPQHAAAIKDGLVYLTTALDRASAGKGRIALDALSYVVDALRAAAVPRDDRVWSLVVAAADRPASTSTGDGASIANDPAWSWLELYCLIAAGLDPADPRVAQLRQTLESNQSSPKLSGLEGRGRYRTLFALTRAMDAYARVGTPALSGPLPSWRTDVASALVSLQHPDSSWSGEEKAASTNLATALAILSLELIYN